MICFHDISMVPECLRGRITCTLRQTHQSSSLWLLGQCDQKRTNRTEANPAPGKVQKTWIATTNYTLDDRQLSQKPHRLPHFVIFAF